MNTMTIHKKSKWIHLDQLYAPQSIVDPARIFYVCMLLCDQRDNDLTHLFRQDSRALRCLRRSL